MKYLYLLFFISSDAYVSDIPDYNNIHKPFWGLSCFDAKNQDELDKCGKKTLDLSTTEMNRALTVLKNSKSEPEFINALKQSQNTWLLHMEFTCKIQTYDSIGGSGFYSIWNSCLETETNERISFLNGLMSNP